MRSRKRRNPGFEADHVQMFRDGGRVEVWNDGEVCVFDPMDRDLDDYNIVPGDVPKLLRLMAEPMARWHHFMREMVGDEVSLIKRRRRNPTSFLKNFHAKIQAIITKRGGSSGSKPMSRLRRRSKVRRTTRRVSKKARRAAKKAAWRKAQAKRLAKLRARKAKKGRKSRYSRKTGRRSVRRTTRRTVRRTRRVRRTSRKTARRSSKKSRRYARRARR